MLTAKAANKGHRESHVPFVAGDGMPLRLVNVRGAQAPTRSPVLLVHGAGVRSNIFRAPVDTTIVDALIEAGYDVWLEEWRASMEVAPTRWTLDEAALYDHPFAVAKVLAETGAPSIKAIVHCQGSTSFAMSAAAGLLPRVETIISNAVSLHPRIPAWSRFKLDVFVPLTRLFIDHLNPAWGLGATGVVPRALTAMTELTHQECDNRVCKLVSFSYGAGRPALWSHQTISEHTHEWLKHEFGYVPLSFHAQMARCVRRGSLVSVRHLQGLPRDFGAQAPDTDARFVLFAGADNRCFLAESQRETFAFLERHRPGFHALHVLPNYGHLDIFMGDAAYVDVFPKMLSELEAPEQRTIEAAS